MNISYKNLKIREANQSDAILLCTWWNDGAIMAHAGFPNGLDTTIEKVIENINNKNLHIIELNNKPIGEMNYRSVENNAAEIGIKICVQSERGKGYGTTLLTIFIDYLFTKCKFEKIILDTNLKNTIAQHVYENKIGFTKINIQKDAWIDQLGIPQTAVLYELRFNNWNKKIDYDQI